MRIDEMPAGREMDKAISQHVFGNTEFCCKDYDDDYHAIKEPICELSVYECHYRHLSGKGGVRLKVYIAGKITGNPGYKEQFAEAERHLRAQGHTTMNPAVLPDGFEHHEYMKICFAMIDVCDAVYLQINWQGSRGATLERNYALGTGKILIKGGAIA